MSSKNIQPLWVLVAGYWLWMIWACSGEWSNNQDYNYGWFVPPLALYFWWKRKEGGRVGSSQWAGGSEQRKKNQGAADWVAWAVVLVSLLLIFPIELVRQTPIHWRPVLWSIGLIAEEACSGLRSLQTALMVGAAAGELARLRTGSRLALLLIAFVLALAGNQVRVLMLVMAGISGGNTAVSQIHDAAGYVVKTEERRLAVGSISWPATTGPSRGLGWQLAEKTTDRIGDLKLEI